MRLASVLLPSWIDRTANAPEANKAKRAHARWLAVKIAIKAQYGAKQGRSAEPQGDVEGVHSGVSYRKQRLDTRTEQKPRKHADRSRGRGRDGAFSSESLRQPV